MFITKISYQNIALLEDFIATMGDSNESFRYYQTRGTNAIDNHLITVVLIADGESLGYGHLDREGSKVWLGIAISQKHRGKGGGKVIMEYLITSGCKMNLSYIHLSVDKNNINAIKLYEKFGFVEINELNNILYFQLNLQ